MQSAAKGKEEIVGRLGGVLRFAASKLGVFHGHNLN